MGKRWAHVVGLLLKAVKRLDLGATLFTNSQPSFAEMWNVRYLSPIRRQPLPVAVGRHTAWDNT